MNRDPGITMVFYFIVLSLPVLCSALINESGYECPEKWGFDEKSKTCVKPFHQKKTWKKARDACKKQEGDLVTIKSRRTTNTIRVLLRKKKNYWIGISDNDKDGKYKYVDRTTVKSYKNWAKHEPNNGGGNEKCVWMKGNKKGSWYDKTCTKKNFFVCQIKARFMLQCPPDWKMYEDEKLCVLVHGERMSWRDARATCQGSRGDLLKLDKRPITRFIKDLIAKGTRYWIGAWDENKDGGFKFVDGKKVGNNARWAKNEPNNYRGNEYCAEIIGNRWHTWNDKRCGKKRNFLCGKQAALPGADNLTDVVPVEVDTGAF